MDLHSNQPPPPGTPVQVFNRFSASWISGFDIATTFENGCELRRRSDDTVLPTTFPVGDVRVERQ